MTSSPRKFGNGYHGSFASRSPSRRRSQEIEPKKCQKSTIWAYMPCYLMILPLLTCPTMPWGWIPFATCSRFMIEPLHCAKERTWPILRLTPTSSLAFWPPSMMGICVIQVFWKLNMQTRRFGRLSQSSWNGDGQWMTACMKWQTYVMTYQASSNHDLVFSRHCQLQPHRPHPLDWMDRKAKAKESPKVSKVQANPRARFNGLQRFNGMVPLSKSAWGIRWESVSFPTVASSMFVRTQWMEKPAATWKRGPSPQNLPHWHRPTYCYGRGYSNRRPNTGNATGSVWASSQHYA